MILLPLSFPDWETASFFSTTLTETKPALSLLELYIPSNPFHALANSIVPAVVLFSLAIGVALIAVEDKSILLATLSSLSDAIMRLTRGIVALAPIGVFAITASSAGTLRLEEVERLQVYIWSHLLIWAVLTFWTFPLLVKLATPIRYRALFSHVQGALITAFATGSLLVVIPMLASRLKQLLGEQRFDQEEMESTVDVIVPTAYNLPNVTMLLTIGFILFAGWFTGSTVPPLEYSTLVGAGAFTSFGGSVIAIPFMLDAFRFPADLFQLFLLSDTFIGRFWHALAALIIAVLCILSVFAINRKLTLTPGRILFYAGSTTLITGLTLGILGYSLDKLVPYEYTRYQALIEMELVSKPAEASQQDLPRALPKALLNKNRLDVIRKRGSLHVGYLPDSLPFAFRNASGQEVGIDMDMAHALARHLDVRLVISRLSRQQIAQWLNSGRIDMVMSGIIVTPEMSREVEFSNSYLDQSMAFVVKDHRRHEFSELNKITDIKNLKLGITNEPYFIRRAQGALDNTSLVPLESPRAFFREEVKDMDGLIFSAEAGAAWTLVYPKYSVVIPKGHIITVPTAYAMPKDDLDLVKYVNAWLDLRIRDGSVKNFYNNWILGKGSVQKPRWSIIRDVLHWLPESGNDAMPANNNTAAKHK
jgi:Na+/H+-dicarboxylate symporter